MFGTSLRSTVVVAGRAVLTSAAARSYASVVGPGQLPGITDPVAGRRSVRDDDANSTRRMGASSMFGSKLINRRSRSVCGRAATLDGPQVHHEQPVHPLLQGLLRGILNAYYDRAPTADSVMELLRNHQGDRPVYFDHLAFRTFGVEGMGISSLAAAFEQFGYKRRDKLSFPGKKLEAYWYSPPNADCRLPRIFISELQVDGLEPRAQAIVRKYTDPLSRQVGLGQGFGPYAVVGSLTGALPWGAPTMEDYEQLLEESEYAAWVLVNGYRLNHAAISVHRLAGLSVQGCGIATLNALLRSGGYALNVVGGSLKVSPDGRLLQSSTVADRVLYTFVDGARRDIAGPYIEFAERLVLPEYMSLDPALVQERHRREGFETSDADGIFDSTRLT